MTTVCLNLNWDAFYSELPYTLLAFVVVDWAARKLGALRQRIEDTHQNGP